MNELAKSIRVGTVNFFGIVVPGLLLIFIMYIGFIIPVISILTYVVEPTGQRVELITKFDQQGKRIETQEIFDATKNSTVLKQLSSGYPFVDIAVLVVVSYVLGYILRLSSPDELDRISATKVLEEERKWQYRQILFRYHKVQWWLKIRKFDRISKGWKCKEVKELLRILFIGFREFSKQFLQYLVIHQRWIIWIPYGRLIFMIRNKVKTRCKKYTDDDSWPFDPYNCLDKYPYFEFRKYLRVRGHHDLVDTVANWGDDALASSKPEIVRRSKSTINKMKLEIREHCPELIDSLESKEAHIRLMAGTWTTFRFSLWLVGIAFVFIMSSRFVINFPLMNLPYVNDAILLYAFICLFLLVTMIYAKLRIEKLFHYRRVSELFHIVQAAYMAEQAKNKGEKSSTKTNLKIVEKYVIAE